MGLEVLNIVKRWATANNVEVKDFDEITNKIVSWSSRTNNNLKQLGLDVNGASYEFNNVGRATQARSLVSRISTVETATAGTKSANIGLDLSTSVAIVSMTGSDGSALAADNVGYVTYNDGTAMGYLVTRSAVANIDLTLTGCHWGMGTTGDFTDVPLHIYGIDSGSATILGVSQAGGLSFVAAANCETVTTSVTDRDSIICSAAVSANSYCTHLGTVLADFDDTGNTGGEDYWSLQSGTVGDAVVGDEIGIFERDIYYF